MKRSIHSLEEPFPNRRCHGDVVDYNPYPDFFYLGSHQEHQPVSDPYPDDEPEEVAGEYPGWGSSFDFHPPWTPDLSRLSLPAPQLDDDLGCAAGELLRLPAAAVLGIEAEPSSGTATISFSDASPLAVADDQGCRIDGAHPTTLPGEDCGWSLLAFFDQFDRKFLSQGIDPVTESNDANNDGCDLPVSPEILEFVRSLSQYAGHPDPFHSGSDSLSKDRKAGVIQTFTFRPPGTEPRGIHPGG